MDCIVSKRLNAGVIDFLIALHLKLDLNQLVYQQLIESPTQQLKSVGPRILTQLTNMKLRLLTVLETQAPSAFLEMQQKQLLLN